MSSFSDILGVGASWPSATSQAGGWTQAFGHRHTGAREDLGGSLQMDGREALGLDEVTWGAGDGEVKQGSQTAEVKGGR